MFCKGKGKRQDNKNGYGQEIGRADDRMSASKHTFVIDALGTPGVNVRLEG